MTHLELWFLSIGLAMDCFAIAIARGMMSKKMGWQERLRTAFLFGAFPALLSFLGWCTSHSFSYYIKTIDHWIVFIILFILGIQMIREYIKEKGTVVSCKDCDNLKVICLLAFATSIDAFAVGISWALLGSQKQFDVVSSALIVGFVSFFFSFLGLFLGYWSQKNSYYVRRFPIKLVGGIVLIFIGGKILVEHLMY